MTSGGPREPEPRRQASAAAPADPSARAQAKGAVDLLLSLGREAQSSDPARAGECLRRALDLALSAGLEREAGHALRALGFLELQTGDIREAETLVERARAKLEASHDALELAICRNTLAAIHLRQGRTEQALAGLRANLPETSELPAGEEAMVVRAETLEQLGAIYRSLGDAASALRCIQDALELRRAANDPAGVAQDLDHLGKLHLRGGALQEARSVFLEAIEMHRARNDRRGLAISLNHLASTLILLGDLREAHSCFEQSRQLFTELGQPRGLASVLSNLGLLATAIGRMDEADAHLAESLRLHRELKDLPAEVAVLNNLSYAAYVRGRATEAVAHAEESLALRRQVGLDGSVAKPLFNLGRALLELDRVEDAGQAAEAAVEAAGRSASPEQRAEAAGLLSEVRLREHESNPAEGARLREAERLAAEAQTAAAESGDPRLMAMTERGSGLLCMAKGELSAARERLSRAIRELRGYGHAFERALLSYDEGRLLHRARSSEAAAERFRSAELEFARLGNDRWRARCLFGLATALHLTQPAESTRAYSAATALARTLGMEPPVPGPAESGATQFAPICAQLSGLQSWMDGIWGGDDPTPDPGRDLGQLRLLLETHLEASEVIVRFEHESVRRWRQHELPERVPGYQTHSDRESLRFVWQASKGATQAEGSLVCEAAGGYPFSLRAARSRPFDLLESAVFALIGRVLEAAMDRWFPPYFRSVKPSFTATIGPSDEPEDAVRTLVGESEPMRAVRGLIRQVAPTTATVLIVGESGTGKELVARALHEASPRRGAAFLAVNCPSIPRELMESELFGHERGAFTGAVAARAGKIELADGGTLFLDEVADMDPSVQAKLLRFLEQREVERVGGGKLRKVDVRVIAATSQSLEERIADGRFREDLFYRLNVVPIRMPALRERRSDIPLLVAHILTALQDGGELQRLDAEALRLLSGHDWPGNVRELRNVLQFLLATSGAGVIGIEQLPPELRRGGGAGVATRTPAAIRPGETLAARLAEVESALVRATLEQCGWNRSAAARRLGVTEGTVRARIRQYGIAPSTQSEDGEPAPPPL
ncbi:MAG: sigma 54-interacting transcriptional regulator [Candidatus Eisenbacteria bacterium]|nr:sigma 54-interacting transcriptional regulator [Candidatus Eisenbacteria bacterium]